MLDIFILGDIVGEHMMLKKRIRKNIDYFDYNILKTKDGT